MATKTLSKKENLVLTCQRCNTVKNKKTEEEFLLTKK